MCGLWGVSGRRGKRINIEKLKILGLYNEARGKDSCGYYWNGNIERGVGADSDFSKFISRKELVPGDLKAKIFMGHTRRGTHGGSTIGNAHPHVVENNLVQTHNGTIHDIWSMCTKYKVPSGGIYVDSIALAHLITKVGLKEILDEYKGSAALAFTWMDNPEALYLYHGASKESKDGQLMSERPLFTLAQPEGLYYSSTIESLDAINSMKGEIEPKTLLHNAVYQIVDGEFTDNRIIIERSENNIKSHTSLNMCSPYSQFDQINYSGKKKTSGTGYLKNASNNVDKNEDDIIVNEPMPEFDETMLNKVLYTRGRYYQITERYQTVIKPNTVSPVLMSGEFIINRHGFVVKEGDVASADRERTFYFISGMMIKSRDDYMRLVAERISGYTTESLIKISHYTQYPVVQLKDGLSGGMNRWLWRGERVRKETFDPKFSGKKYTVHFGRTKKIAKQEVKCTEY